MGNKVYRQFVGIPMGTDCGPLLGNRFLFYYEYRYMKRLINNNSKKYTYTMRYIDDLLNNNGFADTLNNIYPPELELKKTTDCPTTLSY